MGAQEPDEALAKSGQRNISDDTSNAQATLFPRFLNRRGRK